MSKKIKPSTNPNLIIFGSIAFFFVIAFLIGGFYFGNKEKNNKTSTTSELVTYKNPVYGFEITYPKQGQILNDKGQISNGVCGQAIKQEPMSSYNYVWAFDNYFMITEQTFDGTIQEFLNSYPNSNLFKSTPIKVPGATEAVSITTMPGAKPEDLAKSPFAYTLKIIKKGLGMFTILSLQNPGNINGCIPQNDQERDKVADTFKFN